MKCRHCGAELVRNFLDLGFAPPSNAYIDADDVSKPELYFPLKLKLCDRCWLVQTEDYAQADELFASDYAYFSSVSQDWLDHARRYVDMIVERFSLSNESFVIELASNDGYLLKNFVKGGIPCLGIEPTDSTADAAEAIGVPVLREFFGEAVGGRLQAERGGADLIVGNNVYAHVPDINDFTIGISAALKPEGVVTLEFPHLMRLIEGVQFDTVYHEHFSYLSLFTVRQIFERNGLKVFDVEELPTHGGSLRVFGCLAGSARSVQASVDAILNAEAAAGLLDVATYDAFQKRADHVKNGLLQFLIAEQAQGRLVAAYGAAAKGNTLLNYAGVKPDLLAFVCDAAPSKQGKLLPGSRIPVFAPSELAERRPDVVLILPWNIAPEVVRANLHVRDWGGIFVVAVPEVRVLDAA